MSPVREVALVMERELGKNLRSAKGIVLAILCVLGGVASSLIALSGQRYAHRQFDAEAVRAAREAGYVAAYGKEIGHSMVDAPEVLFAMLIGTIALAPFLASLLGFDSVSSELQHRSIRYWTVRTRRPSYMVGKFLGVFATASLMTLVMHVCIWIVTVVKGDVPLGPTITWGLRFWLVSLPISAAWCGLACFVSSLLRTPILALLLSVLGWLVFGLSYVIARVYESDTFTWLYPNSYDRLLLSPSPDKALLGVGASFGFAALFVALALVVFLRRDV
jgi:ABC-type transport system involved in multi-copper enzyme maturation permease subunit